MLSSTHQPALAMTYTKLTDLRIYWRIVVIELSEHHRGGRFQVELASVMVKIIPLVPDLWMARSVNSFCRNFRMTPPIPFPCLQTFWATGAWRPKLKLKATANYPNLVIDLLAFRLSQNSLAKLTVYNSNFGSQKDFNFFSGFNKLEALNIYNTINMIAFQYTSGYCLNFDICQLRTVQLWNKNTISLFKSRQTEEFRFVGQWNKWSNDRWVCG